MTEEEIVKEITVGIDYARKTYDGSVSPAKLAAFLAKHLPALHAPEVKEK